MAQRTLTASELKLAVLDPDWRARWLAGERPSTRTFPPAGTLPALALQFHQEAADVVSWLTSPAHLAAAARIDSAAGLLEQLWARSLQSFTDGLFKAGRADEAALFTERMRSFCARLIELKSATQRFENWQDVFIAAELDLRGVTVPVGDGQVRVRARVDAVRFRSGQHLEVVDYKLSQGAQQKADLIQLAIYAHLLSLWRPGCEFHGTLEYYLPELHEVRVSSADLAEIFDGMVAPVLEEMFAPRVEQARKGVPPPVPRRDKPVSDITALGRATVEAFRSFHLAVEVAGAIEGPQVVRLHLTPGPGVKVASLANRAEDLQVALSLTEPPLIKAGKGFVILDLPRQQAEPCLLQDALAGTCAESLQGPVAFPVGIGIEGHAVVADFAEASTCHVLVAGETGSGKSEWLKSLVASLVLRNAREHVRFALIDPKLLTFGGVQDSPYLWRPVATTLPEAMAILRDAVGEMDARYHVLRGERHVSLGQRIEAGKTDLPFLLLIFDEFADLIQTGNEDRKEFETLVARIAAKGRAAGIHLVLATQRPDRTIVTGLIKANLPMKVCLKVTSATNSQIVLGEPGAESLFGKGDLLCDSNKGLVRAQGLFIPQPEFLRVLGAEPSAARRAG